MLLPHEKVKEIRDNGAENILEEVVEAARKGYCNLYENHPGWVFMRNNLTIPIVKRILDDVCDDGTFTPPALPEGGITGGLCNTAYHVYGTYYSKNTAWGGCNTTYWWRSKFPVNGALIDSYTPTNLNGNWTLTSDGSPDVIIDAISEAQFNAEYTGSTGSINRVLYIDAGAGCTNSNNFHAGDNPVPVKVLRLDGQPDDCGDAEEVWYNDPPPDSDDLTQDIDVTNIDNDTYTYNVIVNPDLGGLIRFSPTLNVNQIGVNINIGGITIGDRLPDSPSNGDDDDPVLFPPPLPGTRLPKELEEEVGEEEEEDVENLVAVKVTITSVPSNASSSSGYGTPDKIYPGWISFKAGNYQYPRQFIDFTDNYYPAPDDADGYSVALKTGYNASVTKVVEATDNQ